MTLAKMIRAQDDLAWLERALTGKATPVPSVLVDDGFVRAALRESRRLVNQVGLVVGSRDFRRQLLRASGIDWRGANANQRSAAVTQMTNMIRGLPSTFLPGARVVLDEEGRRVIDDAHRALGREHRVFRVDPVFSARNERAVEALRDTTSVFFAPEYERQADRFRARAQSTVASGLEQGLGRVEIGRDLRDEFVDAAIHESYWETVAAVHVNRARSFSSAATYAEGGVTQYEVLAVDDERTTEVCFPPGTMVSVGARRPAPIETILPGDLVLGRDGALHEVEAVSAREAARWVRLTLEDGRTIDATPNHPFWARPASSEVETWARAGDLAPGASVCSLREADCVEAQQAEEVLLPRVLHQAPVGGGGLGRPGVRALRGGVQGATVLRQPGAVQVLRAGVQEGSREEGNPGVAPDEGVRRLLDPVQDPPVSRDEASRPLLHGVPEAPPGPRVRGVRRGVRDGSDLGHQVLLPVLLPEVGGRLDPGDPRGDLPGRAGRPLQSRGLGRTVLGRLPARGLRHRPGGRRRLLAPTRRLEEGSRLDLGWTDGGSSGRVEGLEGRDDVPGPCPPGFGWVRVIEVEQVDELRPAHNLQVADDPVYLVEGVLVHNCQMMNGTVLGVEPALNSFDAFEGAESLEEVKGVVAPFMRSRGGAIVLPSGQQVARVGPGGGFLDKLSPGAMNANGINMPPYHHRCRTTVVPVIPEPLAAPPAPVPPPPPPPPPRRRPRRPRAPAAPLTPQSPGPDPVAAARSAAKRRKAILDQVKDGRGFVPGQFNDPDKVFGRRGTLAKAREFTGDLAAEFRKIGEATVSADPDLRRKWNKAVEDRDQYPGTGRAVASRDAAVRSLVNATKTLGADSIKDPVEREARKTAFREKVLERAERGKKVGGSFVPKTGIMASLSRVEKQQIELRADEFFDAWGPIAEGALSRNKNILKMDSGVRPHNSDGNRYFGYTNRRDFHHEFGHSVENHVNDPKTSAMNFNPTSRQLKSYWKQRVEARDTGRARPLAELTGGNYGPGEVSKKDKWGDAYTGKIYGTWGMTEAVSMLSEAFGGNEGRWRRQLIEDPDALLEFVGWMKSVIAGETTRRSRGAAFEL